MQDILGVEIFEGDFVAQAQGKRLPDLVVAVVLSVNETEGYVVTTAGRCKTPSDKLLIVAHATLHVEMPEALHDLLGGHINGYRG